MTHRILIIIWTLTPKYIVFGEINVQMYVAPVATEEKFQKYGEKKKLFKVHPPWTHKHHYW